MFFIQAFKIFSSSPDSLTEHSPLPKKTFSVCSSLSTSYIIQNNFNRNDVRDFLFLAGSDCYYKITKEKFIRSYHLKTDLGYLKFLDSTWTKYADNWRINIVYTEKASNTTTHAYSLSVSSQFFNTYRYSRKPAETNSMEWRSGFLNPVTLSFSYNVTWMLWDYSNVLLGLSAVRLSTRPRYVGATEPKETPVAKTDRAFILAHYGMSGQANIFSKKISENITWDNFSFFFVNGISRDQVSADFRNSFTFRFFRHLQFRFDTHVIYDPSVSYQVQLQQEFLIGLFYEKRK